MELIFSVKNAWLGGFLAYRGKVAHDQGGRNLEITNGQHVWYDVFRTPCHWCRAQYSSLNTRHQATRVNTYCLIKLCTQVSKASRRLLCIVQLTSEMILVNRLRKFMVISSDSYPLIIAPRDTLVVAHLMKSRHNCANIRFNCAKFACHFPLNY